MAEVNPEDTVAGRTDRAFKRKVEELSDGKIIIDLKCSGILGSEKQVLDIIRSDDNSIHMMRGPANLSQIGGKKSALVSIPFTFRNDEHFWKFTRSDVAKEILDEPYEEGLGIKGLFYIEEGFRHLFATVPIKSVEDMKGMKFRVSGEILTSLAQSLGAVGKKVDFTDLYAELLTGAVDVAENPISNYLSNSFNIVAPHLLLDGHMIGAGQVIINAGTWDSLDERQKDIIVRAGEYAQDFCRQTLDKANADAITKIKATGGTVTEVPDKTPWQNACRDMIEEKSRAYPALYEKILELGK